MRKIIHAKNTNHHNNAKYKRVNILFPSQCPHCKTAYNSEPIDAFYFEDVHSSANMLYAIYFCPHCSLFFSVEYAMVYTGYEEKETAIVRIHPSPSSRTTFSDQISVLSPRFVEIYSQAEKAENEGLNEICGIGYRKALEFLIKDYAIAFNPDKEENIKTEQLSACIKNYISSERLKALSTASAWLGNDETHYVRKHEDYNLQHLKIFISAAVSFIDAELTYQAAAQLLSSPK